MVFSLAQINDIIGILTKHKLVFIAEQLGLNYLSQNDKNILAAAGIDLTKYTNSQGQIEHAYLFGLLSEALGDKRAKNMTYAQFQKFIKSGNFMPLTEDEEFALEQLKNRAYTDLNSLGNRIATGTSNIIIRANQTQQNKLRDIVKKKAITAVEHRQTATKLASELGHATDDWERDWLRIAHYLLHEAYNTGRAKSIFKEYGEDAEVWFDVLEKACVHCRELYLTDPDDIDSEPIVFKLKDVIANGSNIGRKVKDWKATISPIHPYCRCTLKYKEPNRDWDRSMHSFSKVKKYVPKNKKLQGVKLNIKISKAKENELEKARPRRPVGTVHPNNPNWVWTEYAPGKFDWKSKKGWKHGKKEDISGAEKDNSTQQPKSIEEHAKDTSGNSGSDKNVTTTKKTIDELRERILKIPTITIFEETDKGLKIGNKITHFIYPYKDLDNYPEEIVNIKNHLENYHKNHDANIALVKDRDKDKYSKLMGFSIAYQFQADWKNLLSIAKNELITEELYSVLLPYFEERRDNRISRMSNEEIKKFIDEQIKRANTLGRTSGIKIMKGLKPYADALMKSSDKINQSKQDKDIKNISITHKEEMNRLLGYWTSKSGMGFNNPIYDDWQELTLKEKYEFIKLAKVTGMVMDKTSKNPEDTVFSEYATILVPRDKTDIVRTIDDILMNLNEGYDVYDENHYIVAYKDGNEGIKHIFTNDLEPGEFPDKLPRKNLLWIAANQGLTEDIYWAKDKKAEEDMIEIMGCTKYINGEPKLLDNN